MKTKVHFDADKLIKFCKENKIRKMAFFGSVIRDDFGPSSDIDIIIEFESFEAVPSLFGYAGMIRKLSRLFKGRKVDLVTYKSLKGTFKENVLSSSEVFYEEAA